MEIWTEASFLKKLEQGEQGALFLTTPMCGTCQVAERMLNIITELIPELLLGKLDLNFAPEIAKGFQVESVPCLLLFNQGKIVNKLYAFHSVPYLHQVLHPFAKKDSMSQ